MLSARSLLAAHDVQRSYYDLYISAPEGMRACVRVSLCWLLLPCLASCLAPGISCMPTLRPRVLTTPFAHKRRRRRAELRHLDAHISAKHRRGRRILEFVQHTGNVLPRLYLLLMVGSVNISPPPRLKDILTDLHLVEMCHGESIDTAQRLGESGSCSRFCPAYMYCCCK